VQPAVAAHDTHDAPREAVTGAGSTTGAPTPLTTYRTGQGQQRSHERSDDGGMMPQRTDTAPPEHYTPTPSAPADEDAAPPPPPPYESVVLYESLQSQMASGTAAPSVASVALSGGTLVVEVLKPLKVGDGMGAHAVYTVSMRTTLPTFQKGTAEVKRRFSDFTWLRTRLQASFPGVIMYPLPEKMITASPFNAEFLEHRRAGLQVFMEKTAAHPLLQQCEDLKRFLQEQGGGAGAAAWYQRGAAGTALDAVNSYWAQITTATESFAAGAGVESMLLEEDPRYLEATEYLLRLEERLKKAVRASDDVVSAAGGYTHPLVSST